MVKGGRVAKQTITYNPQVVDLILYAGDGTNFRLVVTDPLGVPVDLSGTMIAQIRKTRDAPDPPDAEFAADLSNAVGGIAGLELTGDQTHQLAPVKEYAGVWDLQWTPTGTEPKTLCQGKVRCLPDVSR